MSEYVRAYVRSQLRPLVSSYVAEEGPPPARTHQAAAVVADGGMDGDRGERGRVSRAVSERWSSACARSGRTGRTRGIHTLYVPVASYVSTSPSPSGSTRGTSASDSARAIASYIVAWLTRANHLG